ncbi:MAG: hypothetical protein J6J37_04535 [Bacteroidaceae bacterium]|nr:hypothetical protein [Bacteroidaceae bacterium]
MKSIKEYILDVIQESCIFEMAYDRKEIKKRVEGLINQIIENWCLVTYCSLYDKNNTNKYHWKQELRTHLYNIYEMKIKGGNAKTKYNLISEIIYDKKEITTPSKISSIIRIKFRKENIIIHNDICDLCIDDLNYIIELISNNDNDDNTDKIYDYVEQL